MKALPHSICKLVDPSNHRSNDISGMGEGDYVDSDDNNDISNENDVVNDIPIAPDEEGCVKLQHLSSNQFRKK